MRPSPPKFLLNFLKWFCRPDYHRYIEGDLLELFDRRVKHSGLRKANWLMALDVLLLCRPGIIRSFNIKVHLMLKENFKIASRQMLKNKVFTIINLTGLTLGLTVLLLILVWAQNEWSFDRASPNADNIYRVICHWEGQGEHRNVPTIPIRLRDRALESIPQIDEFFVMYPERGSSTLTKPSTDEIFEEDDLAYISKNWLSEFGYIPLSGSIEAFQANKFGLALTEERARKLFGDTNPIGQVVELFATEYIVELVLENNPSNSSFQQKVLLPLESYWSSRNPYEKEVQNSNYKFVAFFKASEQINPREIEEKLTDLMSQIDSYKPTSCSIFPLIDMRFQAHLSEDIFQHQNRASVSIFVLIGILVLLAAILNYINLSTALINKRMQEIGIRKIVGATFRNIFAQFLTETILISLLGFFLALVAVFFLLPYLADYTRVALRLDLDNGFIWSLFALVLVLTMLVAAIYPALLHARVGPVRLIRRADAVDRGLSVRKVLVVSQFTAAIVVLICTAVIYHQLRFIQTKDVGYDRAQVIKIPLKFKPGEDYRKNMDKFILLKNELGQLTEFLSIALTDGSVAEINNRNSGSLTWSGKPEDQSIIVSQLRANEDLNSVFDFKMVAGRWFSSDNSSDKNNIVINETAVKTLHIPNPVIGRSSKFRGREGQIIGVVKDFHFSDLHQTIEPLVIWGNQDRGNVLLARIQADQINQTLVLAEEKFKAFFPDHTFEYTFLDEAFQQMHQDDNRASVLLRGS